jgi:bacteriocin-like protein
MRDSDARPLDDRRDSGIVEDAAELTDSELECVIGGLARPWTEADADEWLVEPAAGLR